MDETQRCHSPLLLLCFVWCMCICDFILPYSQPRPCPSSMISSRLSFHLFIFQLFSILFFSSSFQILGVRKPQCSAQAMMLYIVSYFTLHAYFPFFLYNDFFSSSHAFDRSHLNSYSPSPFHLSFVKPKSAPLDARTRIAFYVFFFVSSR